MQTLILWLFPVLAMGALFGTAALNQWLNPRVGFRYELVRLLVLWYVVLQLGGRLLVWLIGGER